MPITIVTTTKHKAGNSMACFSCSYIRSFLMGKNVEKIAFTPEDFIKIESFKEANWAITKGDRYLKIYYKQSAGNTTSVHQGSSDIVAHDICMRYGLYNEN